MCKFFVFQFNRMTLSIEKKIKIKIIGKYKKDVNEEFISLFFKK